MVLTLTLQHTTRHKNFLPISPISFPFLKHPARQVSEIGWFISIMLSSYEDQYYSICHIVRITKSSTLTLFFLKHEVSLDSMVDSNFNLFHTITVSNS